MLPVCRVGLAVIVDDAEVAAGTRLVVKLPSALVATLLTVILLAVTVAASTVGAQAQIRYWWFRNEPPNAPWKKLSASVYCCASLYSGDAL